MTAYRWFFTTISALAASAPLVGGNGAAAGEAALPAVSGFNGVFGAQAGGLVEDRSFGGFASLAAPLGAPFGVQMDASAGSARGDLYTQSAAHLFWRDPSLGLIGGYASYLRWNASNTYDAETPTFGVFDVRGARIGKAGVEGELYLDRVTLKGLGAYQFGAYKGFAARGVLAWYALDNLRLDVTFNHLKGGGRNASLGVEWAPSNRAPLSLFARAGVNQGRDARVLGGLQIYFGQADKSLIRRHREDLVTSDLPDNLFQTIGAGYCPAGTVLTRGFCDGNL